MTDRINYSWWGVLKPYLVAALAVLLSVPLRLLLDPILSDKLVFVTMFPIVVVVAWYFGVGPAALATIVGCSGVAYFILEPRGSFAIAQPEYRVGIVVNAAVCMVCAALCSTLRRSCELAEGKAWASRLREQQLQHEAEERTVVEQALRQSEEQFRALFDLSAVGQTLADPETLKLTRVNHKYCEITGYTCDELVGRSFLEITHPDDREQNLEGYQRILRGELPEFATQKRYIRKDGSVIWVQVNISLVPEGPNKPLQTAGIVQDITASKQMELSLKDSEERFRGIFDQAAIGVGCTGLDRIVLDVNPGLCHMLGYTREELIGRHAVDLSHPDELEPAAAAMRPLVNGEVESVQMQRRFLHKNGHYIWTHAISSLIRDRDGHPASVVSIVQDITQRKRAEESLREADRRKDEFLAMLAHELRNPLAPICNSLHILRLAEGDAASHEDVVEMIERQVKHMVRLVDDLLEVSRITRDKIELRKEPIELVAIVRSAVEASKPMVEAAHQQLAITLPREPVMLNADPVRLSQVFANLLNNAAKYTDSGGQIWLTANVYPRPQSPEEVVVSVRDTGIGISAAMLPRVFDMFAQSESSSDRAKGGLGIGLTLVKKLVQLHGGSVEAYSEGQGLGSEFVVCLPLAQGSGRSVAGSSGPSNVASVSLSQLSVLIVDDNQDAADSLAIILKRLGLRVQAVYDGMAALKMLAQNRPSVVLLDIGMPGIDGYEVIRQAKSKPEHRDVFFVALTGWGQDADRKRSKEAGFDFHLVKPVELEQLRAILNRFAAEAEPREIARMSQ